MTINEKKLRQLINEDENSKLDFKQEWYQKGKEKSEAIKDIIALANGNINSIGKTAYLIFGVKEKNGKPNELHNVELGKHINEVKKQLIQNLQNHVEPIFQGLEIIEFNINSKNIVVIEIPFHDYLLTLKRDLKGTQYKNRHIIYRIGEGTGYIDGSLDYEPRKIFEEKINDYKRDRPFVKEEEFRPKIEINNKYNYYINDKTKVSVSAYFSTSLDNFITEPSITCYIRFRLSDAKNMNICINEKSTLENLFSDYRSEKNDERAWVENTYRKDNNQYGIKLGCVELDVTLEVINDLSEIFDDLQDVYVARINNIENQLQSKSFDFLSNGFRLLTINKMLWIDIKDFVRRHDLVKERHKGRWDIFDPFSSGELLIVSSDNQDIVDMMLTFKEDKGINYRVDFRQHIDNDNKNYSVDIIWKTLNSHGYIEDMLTVEESYKWLIDKFIPQIFYEKTGKKYNKFFIENCLEDYSYYNSSFYREKSYGSKEIDDLISLAGNMQYFFSVSSNCFFQKSDVVSLYEGLLLLIEKSSVINYKYLSGKLYRSNIKPEYNRESFITEIKKKINCVSTGTSNISSIELVLRCYAFVLKDNATSYSKLFIFDIKNKLDGIRKLYEFSKVKSRMLERLK